MRKQILMGLAATALALSPWSAVLAQSYSNAVMALNPAAYWPLNENIQPPQPINLTALNLGSLGATGNGYYGAWYQPAGATWYLTNNIVRSNAVTFPFDGSTAMACQRAPGQYVVVPRNANGAPNTNITLNPPFSIEAWLQIGTTGNALGDIVSQGGTVNLNTGGPNTNNPFYGGLGSGWAGVELGQYQDYLFLLVQSTNAVGNKNSELDTTPYNSGKGFKVGQWVHVVATFDGTTEAIYTNGVFSVSKTAPQNALGQSYVPDPTTPLMIGAGSDITATYGVAFQGNIEDVAIYNQVLSASSIETHFETAYGTNATYGSSYTNAVLADNPVLYYRLNDPVTVTNAGYPTGAFPVANNYGSLGTAASGLYQPGTVPGVAGPSFAGFGANSRGVAINGWMGGVDVGAGNLPPALNPTNTAPLTVISWFKGNIADSPGRFQEILGHGDSSYRLAMGQTAGENHFNPGPGPELQFTSAADLVTNGFAFNDGNWHMAAGVTDGTNEYLYLDGVLAKSASNASGINITGNTNDLLLGGDSQYTYASAGSANTIRNFDGQIAQVAFFTNALSAAQIQQIYAAAGVPPLITGEPTASITTTAGSAVSVPVTVRGSSPFSYQWYRSNGTAVAGQTTAALTFNPAATNDNGSYYAVVTNLYGSATSTVVELTVYGPPVVTEQSLTNLKIFAGATPTLRVSVVGSAPFSYQWKVGSANIPGATNSRYTVTNTQSLGASTYGCTITNSGGSASITPITVTVIADPTAPYPRAVLADGPIAYYRLDEGPDDGNGDNGVTAYDYVGGYNGSFSNVVLGAAGYSPNTEPTDTSTAFAQFTVNNSYVGNVPSNLDFSTPSGSSATFSVEAWVLGSSGQINSAGLVTAGYGYGGEQFCLDLGGNYPASDYRFYVNDASGATHSAVASLTPNDGIWHHVVGVCDEAHGNISLYVDGVLRGSGSAPPNSGIRTWTTNLSIGSRMSTVSATSYDNQFAGNMDDVAIYNYALTAAQVQAHYLGAGVAPAITDLTPSSQVNTNQGSTVTFDVSALGTAPLSYQWSDPTLTPIPGATTASLTLTNVQPGQAGTYTVTVTNLYGTATTNANLNVGQGPPVFVVDLQPTNLTAYAGISNTFSVTVSGSAPFSYQWYQDNAKITGATNASYTFAVLLGTNTYYVAVTNIYSYSQNGGPTNSSTGRVVGLAAPTLNPADYAYHLKITFAGYTRSETLSNFPALVELGTNLPGFSYSQFASPTGGDLRFTDAGGTREIPHEIDEWNPGAVSHVWVQVPALSSNTAIVAYWGNPAATAPMAWSTNGGVWVPPAFENLPAYEVVYHLKEGAFPFEDSTQNATSTNGTAPAAVPGIVGLGGDFTGTSWLDAGTNNVTDEFTLSAWVNIPTVANIQTIWANQHGGYGAPGFALFVNTYNNTDQILDFASGDGNGGGNETRSAAGAIPFGSWHLIEAAINVTNGTSSFYLDGTDFLDGTAVVKDLNTTNDLRLGEFIDGNFGIHGTVDEARIRQAVSSANWVWADYMTVAQNSAFESYSAINSSAVILGYQVVGHNLVLTWSQGTLYSASQVQGPYTQVVGANSPYTTPLTGPQMYFRVLVGPR
ncbi:exported hypothetical protein [Verrucomicrobia bacterium]|nr:exported hypothetical protein [Verrucomicrobiota bacterium]